VSRAPSQPDRANRWSRRRWISSLSALGVALLSDHSEAVDSREDRDGRHGDRSCNVVIDTALGPIEVRLELTRAPLSSGDFLKYVDSGLYAGGAFYRTVRPDIDPNPVKIEVVQGGLTDESKYLPPIAHEPTHRTGLRHRNGTLSIARDAVGTGTAGAFFICIGDQPELDFGGKRNPDGQGFAAFGQVTRGMKLLHTIESMKTQGPKGSPGGELLASPVAILGARRV
jgi:peptidyl-prolyl cis-trans isomerase A (cyclophilin A)